MADSVRHAGVGIGEALIPGFGVSGMDASSASIVTGQGSQLSTAGLPVRIRDEATGRAASSVIAGSSEYRLGKGKSGSQG